MQDVYRIGVVGCGAVWNRHAVAIERSARLRCTRVYDPASERAAEAAQRCGGRVASTAEEVTAADDVDIVAILTPVFTHAELVEQAAAAGKHLMLEKPLATTLDEAQRIVRAIARAKVKCFHPTLRALASDLFDALCEWTAPDGPVGPVQAGFYHLVGTPAARSAWLLDRRRCFPPAEYMPHILDTFLTLTGARAGEVWCHAGQYCRAFEQDDVTSIVSKFEGNRFLQVAVNWVVDPGWTCGSHITFDLVCQRGMIRHDWFSARWFSSDGQGEFQSARQASGGDRWDHYHALIDAIESDGTVTPNEHDGLNYVCVQDAALRSIHEGDWVTFDADVAASAHADQERAE